MDYQTRPLGSHNTEPDPIPPAPITPLPPAPIPTISSPLSPDPSQDKKEERTWGMACHFSALAGTFVPMGNIIGPLVVWLMKKDEFPVVNTEGKEALNFQLSMTLYFVVGLLPSMLLLFLPLFVLMGISLIYTIVAGVAAGEGKPYRYPLTIRFIQ